MSPGIKGLCIAPNNLSKSIPLEEPHHEKIIAIRGDHSLIEASPKGQRTFWRISLYDYASNRVTGIFSDKESALRAMGNWRHPPWIRKGAYDKSAKRNERLIACREKGMSLKAIAERFGISAQRAHQIIKDNAR